MKITITIAIFLVFSLLNFLAGYINNENVIPDFHSVQSVDNQDSESTNQTETVSTFKIDVNFDELQKKIFISGSLNWVNKNDIPIKEVYMNIPSGIGGNGKLKYHLKLNKLFEQFQYEFVPVESELFIDSSLVKLKLQNELKFEDTLKIHFSFSAAENSDVKWGENIFLQFENWYPQIAVYSSGKFHAYSRHKYIKTFSEFSNYNVNFTIPDHYKIAAPGIDETIEKNGKRTYRCSISKVPSFDWILFNNYIESSFDIKTADQKILLNVFTQKGNDSYIQRYRQAVEKYLNDFSGKFNFPYKSLTIIELPQNEDLLEKSYPTILAVKPKILSPVGSQKLEYGVASLLAEQYLGNIVAPDNFQYAWISKGVSAYIAEKLVRKEYGELYSYFRLARYYPIRGLHFLSFSEIPLIYTLGDEVIPEGGRFINEYYKDIIYCDNSIPSFYFPNYEFYRTASMVKTQLALLTLERYLGSKKLFIKLAEY